MPIPWVYTEIVKNITSPDELVRIIVQSEKDKTKAQRCLTRADVSLDTVEFIITQTDRGWMRDSSPCFVKKAGKTEAVQFVFNGWAKYDNWQHDKHIPTTLAKALSVDLCQAIHHKRGVVLEGGAIDTNGCGTLLTTMECLLDEKTQTRNPGFSKGDYEAVFEKYLGVTNVIWLNQGIVGDDTHGHVDDLCRFVNKNTVVLCREANTTDDNYRLLEENFERLHDARLEDGEKLNIISLPMPKPVIFEGLRLPASYANFYIANKAVLVPTFNDPSDRIALGILQDCFPDRHVVGIHAIDLVWGLGTIHCLSHEEPA